MAMRKYHWVGFTAVQSAELWERWKKGEGLKSIGRVFGKPSSCIFAHLRPSGGVRAPAPRGSPSGPRALEGRGDVTAFARGDQDRPTGGTLAPRGAGARRQP